MKIVNFFFLISLSFTFNSLSDETTSWELLKEGGKVVFIRHAYAPGGGDPNNFELYDCSTQRNLNEQGINQSKRMGILFSKYSIPIDSVYSSEWCRCKETARLAFGNFESLSALNSTFSESGFHNILINLILFKSLESGWLCFRNESKFAAKFLGLTSSMVNSGARIKFVGNPALT